MIQILVIKYEKRIVCITSLTEENEKKRDKLKKGSNCEGNVLLQGFVTFAFENFIFFSLILHL